MKIALSDTDPEKSCVCESLEEAIEAARTWYSDMETDAFKLPPCDYKIQNIASLRAALESYETKIAKALGYSDSRAAGLRVTVAEIRWA